jgi:DNA (cytosine-5)-methyltransferase 1
MLDLFCCQGIGAWGYWLSGRFSEIVGVDINPEMSTWYSFNFLNANAIQLDYEFLSGFDFIHASPPCQGYSKRTPDKSRHMRLVAATHLMLHATGKPYVIENVEGAGKDLKPNLVMDGHYFGLPSERRRYFYVSTLEAATRLMSTGRTINLHGDKYVSREQFIEGLGLDIINGRRLSHMTLDGMKECISPHMTRKIAELMFPKKFMIGKG